MSTSVHCSRSSKWVIVHMLSAQHQDPLMCFVRTDDIQCFAEWTLCESQTDIPCSRVYFKNGTAMNVMEDVSELAEKLVGVTIQGQFDSEPPPGVMS